MKAFHDALSEPPAVAGGSGGKPSATADGTDRARLLIAALFFVIAPLLPAEDGHNAWLRYARLDEPSLSEARQALPAVIAVSGDSPLLRSAQQEIVRGIAGMTGHTLRVESGLPKEGAILLGTFGTLRVGLRAELPPDGYWLRTVIIERVRYTVVIAPDDRGVLYGAFALLRKIALGENITNLDDKQSPYAPIRWVNEWDNLNGTIERGYGGRSIFWEDNHARADLSRVNEYARLLASLGINACAITSVNANPLVLSPDFAKEIARVADVFRPWGVHVAVSVAFGSPKSIGGLDSFDPVEPKVIDWWKTTVDRLYATVPDIAGIVVKADSEGQLGPSFYHRTHADASNVIARALKPHGGILFYRGFVYDNHMDWRNLKNDRGRAAYDNFHDLDGKFDDNVVIQIKHGPIDFQVREPASPLFGALEKTNQAIELQITQEYFGQARQTVFLPSMWKEALDFDMHAAGDNTPVKALVAGKVFHRPLGGFVGVSNVGLDANWFGNHLSQANLYGFGRLAWNPDLTAKQISDEWTRLTFGSDPAVVKTVSELQLRSWSVFEHYTGPLGLQTLTEIAGNHFGPSVESSERNGWGQWHRSDEQGSGMDRTVATGTGFIGQYRPKVAAMYESLATCPDDLLLFMHHVPYTYRLHNGKTVIQYIYDVHYTGAEEAAAYVRDWKTLRGHIDDDRYAAVLTQLEYQEGVAQLWRDAITSWYWKTSGIADAQGRVGRYPARMEAEFMTLDGYTVVAANPWESASGGKGVECKAAKCAASFKYDGTAGWHTLNVRYFDMPQGVAHFRLLVAGQQVAEWVGDDHFPARKLDGAASTRIMVRGIALRPGDEVRVEGVPDGMDHAALDYVEILPD
jgi:alpha-glucuronidase